MNILAIAPRSLAARALSVLALVAVSVPAVATDLARDGRCPADLKVPTSPDAPTDYFNIVGAPTLFIGAVDDGRIDTDVSRLLEMQTPLLRITRTGPRLLVRSQRKLLGEEFLCGWIDERDVLEKEPAPLSVGSLTDWTDPVTGLTQQLPNPLPLKAVLRSNPESDPDDPTTVQIYDRPTITSQARADASVFGIFLIYAEREVDGSFWFWIAGNVPHLPTRFAGWVPVDHTLQWESQLSVYFTDAAKQARIFADYDHAMRDDEEGMLAQRPEDFRERSLGEPMTDPQGVPLDNIARFPILNDESSADGGDMSIYRIGFFGDSALVEQSSERGRKQQNVRKFDMLFVLDNTLSMTEYFPYVVQGVTRATERIAQINEEYEVEVQYAAAIYGDYEDADAALDSAQFQIISRLGVPGYTEHLGRLNTIAERGDYYADALTDRPEAGLAGIVRGIQELQWSENTEFKVVVWIGDHGSRESGDNEALDLSAVARVLTDNDVLLLPINVAGRYDETWNREFVRQGDTLAAVRGLETTITYGDGVDDFAATADAIEQSIATLYVSSLTASIAIREGADVDETLAQRAELLALDIPAAEGNVRRISTAICEMAFGAVGCANAAQSGQFMGEGFARYDAEQDNYGFWVNLDFNQLDALQRVMQLSCMGFERGNIKLALEQAMLLITTTFGGDRYRPDIPIGVFLRRFIFLPLDHFPSILESTPDLIEEQWQAAIDVDRQNGDLTRTRSIAAPICRSAELLGLAFDDKRLIDPQTDLVPTHTLTDEAASEYGWSVQDPSRIIDFNWEWSQGGENNYYYLPVDFFPAGVVNP